MEDRQPLDQPLQPEEEKTHSQDCPVSPGNQCSLWLSLSVSLIHKPICFQAPVISLSPRSLSAL
jgi:hypothetical protein